LLCDTEETKRKKGPPPPIETLLAGPSQWRFHSRGGVAKAIIEDDDGYVQAVGVALCSMADNFNRKVGRAIATERALKQLEEMKSEKATEVETS
jgi:hypothetical protein